ncbi:MAG: ATP synthase F1 subunit epsilon [Rhodobacteraceae bacterium]|nr:ATP synthase F1 subunit epsilon [Paracoccaceae bacterium]
MATMRFDLVSPERNMASGDASLVVLPCLDGDLAALPGHAPFLTTLRPGLLSATLDGAEQRFIVFGGFAEITPEAVTVLADDVQPTAEMDPDTLDARIADAEQSVEGGDPSSALLNAQRLLDLKALKQLDVK